jgi:hypothetical protein
MGYTQQEGMIIGNDFERLSGRFNLDHKLNKRIKVGSSLGYSKKPETAGPNSGSLNGQAFNTSGAGRLAFVTAPIIDPYLYDANGNRLPGVAGYNIASQQPARSRQKQTTNRFCQPDHYFDYNDHTSASDQIQASVYGQLEILKGLTFKTQYGIDNVRAENITFWTPLHGDGFGQNGLAANIAVNYQRWNFQNILNYDFDIAEKKQIRCVGWS